MNKMKPNKNTKKNIKFKIERDINYFYMTNF